VNRLSSFLLSRTVTKLLTLTGLRIIGEDLAGCMLSMIFIDGINKPQFILSHNITRRIPKLGIMYSIVK